MFQEKEKERYVFTLSLVESLNRENKNVGWSNDDDDDGDKIWKTLYQKKKKDMEDREK